jgi:hypothetical protein
MSVLPDLITDRTMTDFYNATDLNRVGEAVLELEALLAALGTLVDVDAKTNWTITDLPKATQMAQYLGNIQALKAIYYGMTPLPDSMDYLTAEGANNIEKLLLEIERHITDTNSSANFGWMLGLADLGLYGGIAI